jgi:hypothetical protein
MADRPYSRRYRKVRSRGELTSDYPGKPGEITRNLPNPGEGFTIRTTGPGVGKPARDVLSVGFAPELGRGAEVTIDPTKSIRSQMREFNDTHLDVLGTKGASMGQGGWADPETGKVEQDTSVLLPRTPEGTKAAMHIGVQSGQAAIGNLGRKGYVGDIPIPHYLQKDQYHGPMGYDPRVEDAGVSSTGRRRVRITPGLQESIGIEAEIASRRAGFKAKPFKEKGAAQYVKESLAFRRKNRKPNY